MGKGTKIDKGIIKVLVANNDMWLTAKEVGWLMRELCGYSASGKTISRRIMGFEYMSPEFLCGGRVESVRMPKSEAQVLKCQHKYRWVRND